MIAPATFLEHGDSEQGLELLEQLVQEHPDVAENQLRLAEAYIALGDPEPAAPHLCVCLAQRAALRRDDQQLLDQLVATAGTPDCGESRLSAQRPAGAGPRPAARAERIQSAAGSAVKSAIIESTKASAASTPN